MQGDTGPVSGTIFGDPFVGFFDETAQTLTILQNPMLNSKGGFNNTLVTPFTVYQGTFFQFTSGGATYSVLSGTFISNTGSGTPGTTAWYAQNPPPVKVGKEGKDGKDHKDGKEGKEHKDAKEKEPVDKLVREKLPEIHGVEPFAPDHPIDPLTASMEAATGQAFIGPDERPAVGVAAVSDAKRLE